MPQRWSTCRSALVVVVVSGGGFNVRVCVSTCVRVGGAVWQEQLAGVMLRPARVFRITPQAAAGQRPAAVRHCRCCCSVRLCVCVCL
jgi:hypothetical protein